jgi:hypothetical protein
MKVDFRWGIGRRDRITFNSDPSILLSHSTLPNPDARLALSSFAWLCAIDIAYGSLLLTAVVLEWINNLAAVAARSRCALYCLHIRSRLGTL